MTEVTTINLKSMYFHARVGVLPIERDNPQPIEVDLSVSCAAFADYRELYEIVRSTVTSGHTELLEEVALRIVDRVMCIAGIAAARVTVRKPRVLLPGPLAYAEVVLERGSFG